MESNQEFYYKVCEDELSEYMACAQCINWNVNALSQKNNAEGYIVQEVKLTTKVGIEEEEKHYYEAWKVTSGKCCKENSNNVDDTFRIGRQHCHEYDMQLSLGKSGCSSFEAKVYWIDEADALCEEIDLWESSIEEAGNLKSINYSKEYSQKFSDKVSYKREKFKHSWDFKDEKMIYNVVKAHLDKKYHDYCTNEISAVNYEGAVEYIFSEENRYRSIKQQLLNELHNNISKNK